MFMNSPNETRVAKRADFCGKINPRSQRLSASDDFWFSGMPIRDLLIRVRGLQN
jgi:hypothetical protein